MTRSSPARFLLPALLAGALAGCAREPQAEGRPKNVVLIVVDTLRADRLGCYGYPRATSPAIDALAARGVRYANNRAQSCWTIPSMMSIHTGRYLAGHPSALPADWPVLAEVLQGRGFATAAFVGNRGVSQDLGFHRGYDHFWVGEEHHADNLVERFEDWFEASRAERAQGPGFFAWLQPYDPHFPYVKNPAGGFDGPRPGEQELEPRWRALESRLPELAPQASGSFDAAKRAIESGSNAYDDEVLAVDAAMARLLAFLEREGALDDTLVIFAADHGEMLWEHPAHPKDIQVALDAKGARIGLHDLLMQGHRAWFHHEIWNTPLILAGPGIPQGVVSESLAANLDILPTVLAALDVPAYEGPVGTSLFRGGEPARTEVFGNGFDTAAVLTSDGLTLIEYAPLQFQLPREAESPLELFDTFGAPAETEDLAAERPADVARLRSALQAWRVAHAVERGEFSERTKRNLRDLGYTED
jgi:arylsulfatase A-like enzyme